MIYGIGNRIVSSDCIYTPHVMAWHSKTTVMNFVSCQTHALSRGRSASLDTAFINLKLLRFLLLYKYCIKI